MKNLLLLLLGGALLVSPSLAQSDNNISLVEFRQSLSDFLTVADAHRGTNFSPLLASVPDSTLAGWYTGVRDGRRFQQAVNGLKARMYQRKNAAVQSRVAAMSAAAYPARRNAAIQPGLAMSSWNTSGSISSVVPPDYSLYSPNFPSGWNWSNLVGVLQEMGDISSRDASDAGCDTDSEAGLSIIVSTFQGVKDAADGICQMIPDPLVVILGEGASIPLKEICYGVALIIGAFSSASDGYLSDCHVQGDLTDSTHVQAGYNDTLSVYNLEIRLMIEENLQATAGPIGLFELPGTSDGGAGFLPDGKGYIEVARSIVSDTINNMYIAGVNVATAQAALATGDALYNSHSYKAAYKQYQRAYGLAVQ